MRIGLLRNVAAAAAWRAYAHPDPDPDLVRLLVLEAALRRRTPLAG